jgi:hypothetical protein
LTWYEYTGNLYIHTTYSDGVATFDEAVDGAVCAGADFIYVTDHNVLVCDREEGYRRGVLTLVGQEVHDDERVLQRNHLLGLGVTTDRAGAGWRSPTGRQPTHCPPAGLPPRTHHHSLINHLTIVKFWGLDTIVSFVYSASLARCCKFYHR